MSEAEGNQAGAQDLNNGNTLSIADKLKFFSEHVRGVLTLASAAVPAIVGVFGLLFKKDAAGNAVLPDAAKSLLFLPALAVGAFLISILSGVTYSYFLCKKSNELEVRMPSLDWSALALHVFFAAGVLLFSVWAAVMILQLG